MSQPLHHDELRVDLPLVRALVDRSLPELAGLPLSPLASSGSSNALFRLGDDLLVRMPRAAGGSESIAKEARWLPQVDQHVSVSVPSVVAVGEPGFGYPEAWSVVSWIDGEVPRVAGLDGADGDLARDLGTFVTDLRSMPRSEAALVDPELRWYRGGPLADMDATTRANLEECRSLLGLDLDLEAASRVWDDAMRLPAAQGARPRWLHGDLVAENLLVRDGRLVAVLDFGGLALGDPTVDLVVAWEVLDPAARELFRAAVDVDEETWLRGRAWALAIALMTFPYYWTTMPRRCADRLAMARAVLADAGC